jgi:hypothetical protein
LGQSQGKKVKGHGDMYSKFIFFLDSIQESRAEQFQCKRIQTASQRRQQYRMDVFTSIFGQQYE